MSHIPKGKRTAAVQQTQEGSRRACRHMWWKFTTYTWQITFAGSNQSPQLLVPENPEPLLPADALSRTPLLSSNCLCTITAPNLQDPECSGSNRIQDCLLQPFPGTLVGTGFKNKTKKNRPVRTVPALHHDQGILVWGSAGRGDCRRHYLTGSCGRIWVWNSPLYSHLCTYRCSDTALTIWQSRPILAWVGKQPQERFKHPTGNCILLQSVKRHMIFSNTAYSWKNVLL